MPRLRLDPFSPSGVSIVADSPRAKQQNGYVARTEKLSQISDVDALSPSNGQALAYNSTTKTWKPTTISGGTGGTGSGDVTSPGGTGNAGFVPLFGNDGGTTLVKSTIDNTGGGLAVDGPITSKGSSSNYSLTNGDNQQVFNVATGSSVLSGGMAPYANMMLDGTTYLPLIVLDEVAPTAITTDQQYAGASLLYQDNTDHKLKVSINGGTIDNVATEGYVAAHAGTPADATTTTKGVIELTGDLAGTATAPTVTNLHLAADTAIGHKLTSITDPTNAQDAATKNYVDSHTSSVSDATTTTKGIVQLAGDLAGTAALPTVPGLAGKVATTTTVNGHALSSSVVVSASDLTTGTLPIGQGGTGATATTGSGSNVLSTSPSLTTPKADIITDTNGGKEIELVATASSANWVKLTNTVAGSGVTVGVNGTGTNENLTLAAMGTGTVQVGGSQVTTAANTQIVTNKNLTSATNTFPTFNQNTTGTAANVTGTVAIANGGTGSTTQNFVDLTTAQTVAGVKTFSSAPSSTVATGTAPLTITSTTKVTNLNADQVDGFHASATVTANTLLPLDTNSTFPQSVVQTSTLGYAQITANFSTASTTAVQVTGLTATVTVPSGGRRVKITVFARDVFLSAATAGNIIFSIWDGTVGTGTQIGATALNTGTNSGLGLPVTAYAVVTPAAGSKTYNIGMQVPGSTGNLEAGTTYPAFILVELI